MDWNLFGCARRGHVTYAPDEPALRDRLMAPTALVINLLLVIYLVWAKRLFGVRGGKTAYEARLRSESVIEVEHPALAAASPSQPGHAKPANATVQPAGDKPRGRGATPAAPQTEAGLGRPRRARRGTPSHRDLPKAS
jgi:hypothetical protein